MFKASVHAVPDISPATSGADQRLDLLIRLQTEANELLRSIRDAVSAPQQVSGDKINLREPKKQGR